MAAKTLLDSLRAQFKEQSEKATEILNKKERTAAETSEAIALVNGLEALKARIGQEAELESKAMQLKDLDTWANEPERHLPFGGSKTFATQEAGHTKLLYKNGFLDSYEDVGPGTFGEKNWNAICSKEYAHSFKKMLRRGERGLSSLEEKDLQLGLDDQGGTFVPADWLNRIISRKPAPTSLLNRVTRLTTGRDKLVIPRLQYSADEVHTTAFRPVKTGEIPASDTTAQVTDSNLTGNVLIDVNTYMMSLPVGLDFMEDSAFPADAFLSGKFSEEAILLYESMALNGTGNGEADGILNKAATSYAATRPEVVLSGTDATLTFAGLTKTQNALAPQYENDNTAWVMNKRDTLDKLQNIKDSNNRPLFSMGMTTDGLMVRRERVLLGDPIALSMFMPNTAASAFPIAYGDFRGYYHLDRIGFSIQVLREVNARRNQVVLVGRLRFGGAVVEPWTMKILKSHSS